MGRFDCICNATKNVSILKRSKNSNTHVSFILNCKRSLIPTS